MLKKEEFQQTINKRKEKSTHLLNLIFIVDASYCCTILYQ